MCGGTVAAVGDDVATIKTGDRVVTANANGATGNSALTDFVAYVARCPLRSMFGGLGVY